jgi:hypothetical protein
MVAFNRLAGYRSVLPPPGFGKNFSDRSSTVKLFIESVRRNSHFFRPLNNCFGLSIVRQKAACPSVSSLFSPCRPSAVSRLVVPVVVDAFDCVLGSWLRSHVCKKGLKRVNPAITNLDSATAVKRKGLVFRIQDTRFHRAVANVFRRAAKAVRFLSFPAQFRRKAATAFCSQSPQLISTDNTICPTFTPAVPPNAAAARQDCQPAERHAGQVDKSTIGRASAAICIGKISHGNNTLLAARASTDPCMPSPVQLACVEQDGPQAELLAGNVFESGIGRDRLSFNHDVTLLNRVAIGQSRQALARLFGSLHFSMSAHAAKAVS